MRIEFARKVVPPSVTGTSALVRVSTVPVRRVSVKQSAIMSGASCAARAAASAATRAGGAGRMGDSGEMNPSPASGRRKSLTAARCGT